MKDKSLTKIVLTVLTLIIALSLLCSCAASDKSYRDEMNSGADTDISEGMTGDSTIPGENQSTGNQDRKLIRKISMSIQTKDFDTLLANINSGITQCGGYVESSRSDGEKSSTYSSRHAHIIARIPASDTDTFIASFQGEHVNVISREESSEDVTLSYVDTESRLSSLRAQKQSLEALYEKAESISEITYVQKELTSVISEIEAYEATLRQLSSLVSYSTVTLDIREVEVYTEPEELTFGQEITQGFKNSLDNVGSFFRWVAVRLVSDIPYLAIWIPLGGAVFAFVLIIKRSRAKKRAKKVEKQ